MNSERWSALPYEAWSTTCDTLHAHTQVLGGARGRPRSAPSPSFNTLACTSQPEAGKPSHFPRPDHSGRARGGARSSSPSTPWPSTATVVHTPVPPTPDRPVADVTRELLAAVADLVGPVSINTTPQETPWTTPLDEDLGARHLRPGTRGGVPRGRDAGGSGARRNSQRPIGAVPRP